MCLAIHLSRVLLHAEPSTRFPLVKSNLFLSIAVKPWIPFVLILFFTYRTEKILQDSYFKSSNYLCNINMNYILIGHVCLHNHDEWSNKSYKFTRCKYDKHITFPFLWVFPQYIIIVLNKTIDKRHLRNKFARHCSSHSKTLTRGC